MPEQFAAHRDTWAAAFPDFRHVLWTEKEIAEVIPRMVAGDAFESARNVATKSDIARLEVLRLFGGIYVDTDFECLKRFDFLPSDCFCYADEQPSRPGNAFLAAPRGHPFLSFLLAAIGHGVLYGQCHDPVAISGPLALHRALQAWAFPWKNPETIMDAAGRPVGKRYQDIAVMRQEVFYPFWHRGSSLDRWRRSAERGSIARDFPAAVAAHHWAKSWK